MSNPITNSLDADLATSTRDALVKHLRAEVRGASNYAAYVAANGVTRETVAEHAKALANLAFPKDEGVQKRDGVRTPYGNAVQAAGAGLRRALPVIETEDETGEDNTDWLALATQAVTNAAEHDVDLDTLTEMLTEALRPYLGKSTPVGR